MITMSLRDPRPSRSERRGEAIGPWPPVSLRAMALGAARARRGNRPVYKAPDVSPPFPVPRHTGRLPRRLRRLAMTARIMSLRDHRPSRSEGRGEAIARSTKHLAPSPFLGPPSPVCGHIGRLPRRLRRLAMTACIMSLRDRRPSRSEGRGVAIARSTKHLAPCPLSTVPGLPSPVIPRECRVVRGRRTAHNPRQTDRQ